MHNISIVGGTYREVCLHPQWCQLFGSGVRAAAALNKENCATKLFTICSKSEEAELRAIAATYGFDMAKALRTDSVEFQYDHSMAPPRLLPSAAQIALENFKPISINAKNVLHFGLLERVQISIDCENLVYDPQACSGAKALNGNDVRFSNLAVIANAQEICSLAAVSFCDVTEDINRLLKVGQRLLPDLRANVIIIKCGPHGAYVITPKECSFIPPHHDDVNITIGSGDIFSSIFAYHWSLKKAKHPVEAARLASVATSQYCRNGNLPIRENKSAIRRKHEAVPAKKVVIGSIKPLKRPKVYLAGPFFDIAQLWLLSQAHGCLQSLGFNVFSPKDDVGLLTSMDQAKAIATEDLAGLTGCNIIFALISGMDTGTIFELGYATKMKLPIVCFGQNLYDRNLTMLLGTNIQIYTSLSNALYQAYWTAHEE